MRSGVAGAALSGGVCGGPAPPNRASWKAPAPRLVARRRGWSARPDEFVLTLVALDQGRVDRSRERRIVELDRDVFDSAVLAGLAPACTAREAPGGHAVVGGALAFLGDGLDGRLGIDVDRADRAVEAAVLVAGEGADLSHCRISSLFPGAAPCGLGG